MIPIIVDFLAVPFAALAVWFLILHFRSLPPRIPESWDPMPVRRIRMIGGPHDGGVMNLLAEGTSPIRVVTHDGYVYYASQGRFVYGGRVRA